MARFTVFNVRPGGPTANVGDVVEVSVKDGPFKVLECKNNSGESLGAVAMAAGGNNGVKLLLPNSVALNKSDLDKLNVGWTATAKVVDQGTIFHGQPKQAFAIELMLPWEKSSPNKTTQQGDVTLTFKVLGAMSQNPGKAKVVIALNQGDDVFLNMELGEKGDAEIVYMMLNGEKAGFIQGTPENKAEFAPLVQLLKNGVELEAKAFDQTNGGSYHVKVLVSGKAAADASAAAAKTAMSAITQRIIDEGIASAEKVERVYNWLLDCGIGHKQIEKIFKRWKKRSAEVEAFIIDMPKVLYQDTNGYVKKAIAAVLAGKPLAAIGDAGTGKNCLIESLAWAFHMPYFDMSMNAQSDKYDLQGSQTIDAKETDNGNVIQKVVFTPEKLLIAMECEGWCNVDEANTLDPGVASLFHPITDNRRSLFVAGYRHVVAGEHFQLSATMNLGYAGTRELNPALKSRLSAIKFKSPESIEDILKEACKFASRKDITTCNKIYKKIIAASSDSGITIDVQVSAREFIGALELVEEGLSLFEALEMTIIDKIEDDDYCKAITELIQMNCPN